VEHLVGMNDGSHHDDDVTMLLFRITNRSVRLRDNLAAPFRWLKGLFVKN
jgi:hypothetical protein